ncbi:VanZ family protein [Actinosynnema mirum]|uniref:VanZ family protein n=1 Tax=Actinosynnema mirum (strain ATCC 29888 / DSM 43827 / JCM 3225 / NBRC 14064 / NCIMB 13271 / NRRL B-12336 / IMRU 3971 / 101) TaxID=446462 RepID=C6WLG3_ACTMD|nr:VanZ family protein [Actinosynnema mirum]ACU38356.1 VanZ family protein [Actinosynnema mirum DSM 43827]
MPGTPRTRGIVLTTVAVLVLASVLFALRRPLMMAAPACAAGRWHGCLGTENGVVLVTLVGVPVAVLAAWALARLRGAGAWRASVAEVGMVYGTLPWLWITLMPGERAGEVPGRLSLLPLRDLLGMGPLGIVGNLLVFAALGFFAPVRFPALASAPRALALGAVCSLLVETAQYVLQLDRVSSVDDVLLNATGAALAALASRRWWARAPRPRPAAARP